MRLVLLLAVLAGATAAQAQLYRWVDPASGSVKYSSYPPPWMGDPARERRSPKVEVIPPGKAPPPQRGETGVDAGPAPEPAKAADAPPASSAAELNARRKAMLEEIAAQVRASRGNISPELQKRVEAFGALVDQLNRADPAGAAARNAEIQAVMQEAMQAAAQSPRAPGPQ